MTFTKSIAVHWLFEGKSTDLQIRMNQMKVTAVILNMNTAVMIPEDAD